MSQPKRYEIGVNFIAPVFVPVETEVGDWIRYVDYAILRSVAEDNKRECEATRIEIARLKAEVERLTKAGWQPMETAPFNRNIRIIVDRNDEGEVGIIWSSDVQHYSVEQYPDWWMPLPVAPAKEGKTQP